VVTATTSADLRRVLAEVTDPEVPVLSLEDLGVLRDVRLDGERVVVTLTPTYSGCPAMDEMRADVRAALQRAGHSDVEVRTVLSPAWTTDDMTDDGRRKLREFGIAPPARRAGGPVPVQIGRRPDVACPLCGSTDTEELSRFASTSCKSLWRCRSCREPFDHFKAH
jgi:ring-1,2-phenylacetyl-CoA epoxidase subunit PaaD